MNRDKNDFSWRASVLTLFPDMFPGPLKESLSGRALVNDIWSLKIVDIRQFACDKYHSVDDAPFGGGGGMVMRPDVVGTALSSEMDGNGSLPLLYPTPRGYPLTQKRIRELAAGKGLVILCGHYEGVDQRVLEKYKVEEVCIGDYILSGGELAALVVLDACVRLLPGVVGNRESIDDESFESGLLEHPHYTRPRSWQGRDVPEVLLSGHHGEVSAWRRSESEEITRRRRPDLWQQALGKLSSRKENTG